MGRTKKEQERYLEKRKEMKKLSMRKARERMRTDPVKYEEAKAKDRERYRQKKEEGKIKLINEMSSRDKRLTRKEWKKRSAKYRSKKKGERDMADLIENNTPPLSPELHQEVDELHISRQQESGKKQARKNREKKNKKIKELEEKLKTAYSKVNKYKKRLSRIKLASDNKDTPRKKVATIVKELKKPVTPEIKKKLLFAEVISKQIIENYKVQKSNKGKRNLAEAVTGQVIKKYKFTEYLASLTSAGRLRQKQYHKRLELKRQMKEVKKEVHNFLAKDESSRLTAGKKETLTRKKIKKQKRLLNDSLKNLHKKFVIEHPKYKYISYSLFCKFRPFWIVPPNAANRNTCLCKVHDNMKLLMSRISTHKIIEQSSANDLVHSLCCKGVHTKEECLERRCTKCINKVISPNEFNPEELTFFDEWKTIIVPVIIKGEEKKCKKIVKAKNECTKGELLSKLKAQIVPFMQHLSNIKHQFTAVDYIKKNLKKDDILLQFDFSENYNCKYTEEIQSAHFGGSKPQITLHTSVCYYKSTANELVHKSFCTVSKSTRHDTAAVVAHLDCVLDKIKETLVPDLKKIHLLSDGPSSQYINKTIFYLLTNHIAPRMKCDECIWNYCEAGHGKGSPDGIGGYLKRTADGFVATGTDIPNYETFVSKLKSVSTKVDILTVEERDITTIDVILPKREEIATFKGTLMVHQISWSMKSSILQARRLSCTECEAEKDCTHYGIGKISFSTNKLSTACKNKSTNSSKRIRYEDIYSDSDNEEGNVENVVLNKRGNGIIRNCDISNGDWVAVIYDNMWYPGIVEKKHGEQVDVNYMHHTSTGNYLYWPSSKDIQTVEISTILCKINHSPYPVSSRQFKLKDEDFQCVEECFNSVL